MLKRVLLYVMAFFYLLAGVNHFRKPLVYEGLIPPYLPWHNAINIAAGVAEILLGTALLFSSTKRGAAYGIVWLMILFIPAHIYFIQLGGCLNTGLCFPAWVGWVRLLIIHPLLLAWAWWYRK